MKIDTSRIPPEGLTQEEEIKASELALDEASIKLGQPVRVRAEVFKITNAVTIDLLIEALMCFDCSRCLNEFLFDFKKNIQLSFQVDRPVQIIDLNDDIRQEIVLAYPLKPLCKEDCRGMCFRCGRNLNESNCNCSLKQIKQ